RAVGRDHASDTGPRCDIAELPQRRAGAVGGALGAAGIRHASLRRIRAVGVDEAGDAPARRPVADLGAGTVERALAGDVSDAHAGDAVVVRRAVGGADALDTLGDRGIADLAEGTLE